MAKVEKRKISRAASLFTCLFAIVVFSGLSIANGQTTGSISGSVFESDCTTAISGVTIYAYPDHESDYSATSDGFGQFTIKDLPEGDYYIYVSPGEDQNYVAEYYNNITLPLGVDLDTVHVAIGEDATLDDICLDAGATISGTVYETGSPATLIEGARVSAIDYNTWATEFDFTDGDGEYEIIGLPAGDFFVSADATGQNYIKEHYDNVYSSIDASAVTVVAGGSVSIDFALDPGGSISGRVTNSNGEGVADVAMVAYSGACSNYMGSVSTDEDGYYTLAGMPEGDICLWASPSDQYHVSEWYNDAASCHDAEPIAVVTGGDTGDINFELTMSGSISGHVYESDGTTPIADSQVLVLSSPWNYNPGDPDAIVVSGYTDTTGEYTISGLSAGEIYIFTYGIMPEPDETAEYVRNWYNDSFSWEEAEPVTVVTGTDAGNIDFRLYPYSDSDADNMPDQWEYVYFGDLSNDGFGDSDNDGISDVDEYTYGTVPVDLNTNDEIEGSDEGGGGGCFIGNLF